LSIVPSGTGSSTLGINGTISGTGTITGDDQAGIVFSGANNNSIGTLNYTTGFQLANRITVNLTGTNASVTLGTPVTVLNIAPTNNTLDLTAGTLNGSSNLTLGNGAIVSRSAGSLDAAPVFGSTVNVTYNGATAVSPGFEMPANGSVLNNLVIGGTADLTLSSDTTVNNNLTLNSGSLTVSTLKNLKIQNALINNTTAAAVIIESGANLIQVNNVANTGDITVKRNSSLLKRLDYTIWSSPTTNASQFLKTFSPLTLDERFYNYNETTNLYNAVTTPNPPSATEFEKGAGYLIRMPNTADAITPAAYSGIFTGVPNNGTITKTISYLDATHGYNMVGNPYPSTIDAQAFIIDNTANIESSLYFWRKTNDPLDLSPAYAVYNSLGSTATASSAVPNGTIQVGQGFFVKAKSGATAVSFTNTMRLANNANQFFKTKQVVEKDRVWLNLTNTAGAFSQALVGYTTDATQGVDVFDAKYFNDCPTALTSNINNEEYTIQGRTLPFDPSDVVALNFKTNVAGDYTIALDHFDGLFATGQDIFLKDNTTGAETDLKAAAYTFTAAAGVDNARFSLKYQKTLKVDAPAFNENNVSVYKNNGMIYVNSGTVGISNIKVFDIQGRLIAEQKNVKATTAIINNLKATHQVLIVKIACEDNNVVTKKVVN
jgi:hypothetical protein